MKSYYIDIEERNLEFHDTAYRSHFMHKNGDGTQYFSDLGRFGDQMEKIKAKECGVGGEWRVDRFDRKSLDAYGKEFTETVEIRRLNASDSVSSGADSDGDTG